MLYLVSYGNYVNVVIELLAFLMNKYTSVVIPTYNFVMNYFTKFGIFCIST